MRVVIGATAYKLPGSATGTRRKLVFRNSGAGTIYWGWESNVDGSTDNQGVPITANEGFILDGADILTRPLYFFGAGQILNWTECA